MLPALTAKDVHVWAIALDVDEAAVASHAALLSTDEQQRAERFYFEHLRRRFTVSHGALRWILSRYARVAPAEIELVALADGKPALAERYAIGGLKFNLTHSGELALVAVTRGSEVGVDAERLREVSNLERLARRYFHDAEVEEVLGAPTLQQRYEAFLRCWTGKEAVVKAYGTGIGAGLRSFRVPLVESTEGWADLSAMPRPFAESRCWLTQLMPCRGYIAACATIEQQRNVAGFEFNAERVSFS